MADHYDSASGLTLTASRADLLKTLAQSRPHSYGLLTRFSPSHIAQFWRDWTAMLGYRSADQEGGYVRASIRDPLSHQVIELAATGQLGMAAAGQIRLAVVTRPKRRMARPDRPIRAYRQQHSDSSDI